MAEGGFESFIYAAVFVLPYCAVQSIELVFKINQPTILSSGSKSPTSHPWSGASWDGHAYKTWVHGHGWLDHFWCKLDQLHSSSEIWSCNVRHLRQSILWEPVGKDKPSQGLSQVKACPQSRQTNWICRLENEEWSPCIRRIWCPGRKMELHKQDQSLHTLHPQRARWVEGYLNSPQWLSSF